MLAALAAASLASCGGGDHAEQASPTSGATSPASETVSPTQSAQAVAVDWPRVDLLKSDLPRAEPDATASANTAAAMQTFAMDLYGVLARGDGNLVLSPYSIMSALSMARAGAAGETLEEMSSALHADQAGSLDAGLNAIEQALATRSGEYEWSFRGGLSRKGEVELAPINQMWLHYDYPFHRSYLDTLATQYGAGIRLADFINAGEDARKTINAWGSEQTHGRIEEILPPGALDADTRFVLVNAIYFKASWAAEFAADMTHEAPFTRLDGSEVQVQMMHHPLMPFRYAETESYQAVELPFVDGSMSMLVVVPRPGRFADVESTFDNAELAKVLAALEAAKPGSPLVDLRFPRFEFTNLTRLRAPLEELGMRAPFDPTGADFSGMSPKAREDQLYLQDALHQAYIAVNEKGAEAAAVTAIPGGRGGDEPPPSVELTVDRPFMFFIRDHKTGVPLFMGRLVDPESATPSPTTETATVAGTGSCLYLRSAPSMSSTSLGCYPDGTQVVVAGGQPILFEGRWWLQVEVQGRGGWMASEFLRMD